LEARARRLRGSRGPRGRDGPVPFRDKCPRLHNGESFEIAARGCASEFCRGEFCRVDFCRRCTFLATQLPLLHELRGDRSTYSFVHIRFASTRIDVRFCRELCRVAILSRRLMSRNSIFGDIIVKLGKVGRYCSSSRSMVSLQPITKRDRHTTANGFSEDRGALR
jgi:hypothetical protein